MTAIMSNFHASDRTREAQRKHLPSEQSESVAFHIESTVHRPAPDRRGP
jgi:hypothetical protein